MAVMTAKPGRVNVRMYRQGLGDCFLLAFGHDSGQTYVVIDCGIFYGSPGGSKIMTDVAKSIRDSTNGQIDVLIVTHEHYDHLSGFRFKDARKIWDTIKIVQVWAAWTEDPKHPVAKALKGSRAKQEAALRLAANRLRAAGDVGTSDHIMGLLGFSAGVRKDLEYVLGRVDKPTYLRPGTQVTKSLDTPGFRCYVLGPPDDDDTSLLKKSNPSKVESEVYEHSFSAGTPFPLSATDVFASGILACASHSELRAVSKETGAKIDGIADFSRPFAGEYEISVGRAKQQTFFRKKFGFTKRTSDGPQWRRIDTEWLAGAAGLAMQLDGAVNNTSLVLAFEIAESGKVLLFPGDAQVGNMLSWHKHCWDVNGDQVKAEDLLHRTSFYKVGHHGSHNATLKNLGLELMNGDDFTAVIPVSKVMAAKQGRKGRDGKPVGWKMPFKPLLDALTEKAEHRVIQADDGRPSRKPSGMSNSNWTAFKKRVKQTKLFVEIEV